MQNTRHRITDKMIRFHCPSNTIYLRGATYYKQGRVTHLAYNADADRWQAFVSGSELYEVYVELEDDGWLNWECDCPAFEKYEACKHVVAASLQISQQQEQAQFSQKGQDESAARPRKYRSAQRVIQSFMDLPAQTDVSADNPSQQPLQVAYICKTFYPRFHFSRQQYLTIECKVGVERTYVVKDLRKFLQSVREQTSYFFTKKYSYEPSEQCFRGEDWQIMQLLETIMDNEDFSDKTSAVSPYNTSRNSRFLVIPPMMADALLDKLKNRQTTVEIDATNYHPIDIQKGQMPLSFEVDANGPDEFVLNLDSLKQGVYFEPYQYLFHDGTFYKLSSEQAAVFEDLAYLRHPSHESDLPVSHDQMEMLVSHVMPQLKKLGEVEMDEEVSKQIADPPLQADIYLDRDDERLIVKIEYHYGDIVINPFATTQNTQMPQGTILMRDSEREQAIMNILEHSPIRYNGSECFVEGEEENYDFLFQTTPQLEEKANIYMTASVRSLFLTDQKKPETNIDVDSDRNLLEISFDMEGINNEDVQHILQSVAEKQKYYRLPDGAFVSLQDENFQQMNQLLQELNVNTEETDGTIEVPLHRSLQVDNIVNEADNRSVKAGKNYRRLVQDLKNPDTLDFTLPENLHATLRDYQQFGYQWLKTLAHYGLGGVLADDMGLGKTLQSIAYLLSEKAQNGKEKPSLIIAPSSVLYNWKDEFDKFSSGLNVGVVYGTPTERIAVARDQHHDVLITSYPLLRQDAEIYQEQFFDTLILDEAQAIKNQATKTAKAVKKIGATKRFALSGTPIENSLDELWSIFDAILPGFFGDHKAFKQLSQEKITKMARPFILRRLKEDVLKELPEKIETVYHTDLTKEQKELYLGYLEKIQQETKQSIAEEGFQKSRIKILAGLTRLRQVCCHPSLFLENYEGTSGKLEQLMDMVQNAQENGQRLLIFSQFSSMLAMIRERLQKENVDCFYLDGQTPSLERTSMAERFNNGEKDVFLVSLKAGGTGLNLTGADTVILYDLWWNPAVEEQAAGRAHRIGQKNVVQVMRVIARGTIEEKIYDMQQKKKELIEQVVKPEETMLTSLSEDEIKEILGI